MIDFCKKNYSSNKDVINNKWYNMAAVTERKLDSWKCMVWKLIIIWIYVKLGKLLRSETKPVPQLKGFFFFFLNHS